MKEEFAIPRKNLSNLAVTECKTNL